jgi:hypothetical protein
MKRRGTVFLGIFLISLILTSVNIAIVSTSTLPMSSKKRFDLRDEVKHMAKPDGAGARPTGAPLKVEIVYPDDGSTISLGAHVVLVSAYAKSGVDKVELMIDGPEPLGWTEMTLDGMYYAYDWTVGTDGAYYLTARVTDTRGKTKQATDAVYVGVKPPQKWAVVIGIADYKGRDSDLWHPDEDAKEMESELINEGYPEDNIKLLLNRKATAAAIEAAIDWLVANEQAGDEVVFFYSGHGYRAPDVEGWDGDLESDGQDEMIVTHDIYGLPDGWFRAKFAAVESTKFALMFGSCHSGGMFDDDDDLQGTGRVIAAACEADQYGWDYLTLGNTLWGYWFVDQGLLGDNADSVESAHAYAYPYVVAEQPDSQPQLSDYYAGDFGL